MIKAVLFDLDGTLIVEDTTMLLLRCVLVRPWRHLRWQLFANLRPTKYAVKQWLCDVVGGERIAQSAKLNPFVQAFFNKMTAARRTLWLVSGAPHEIVYRVSERCGSGFSFVQGSLDVNLTGVRKSDFLVNAAPQGFDYVGNSMTDLPVWLAARRRFVVGDLRFVHAVAEHLNAASFSEV